MQGWLTEVGNWLAPYVVDCGAQLLCTRCGELCSRDAEDMEYFCRLVIQSAPHIGSPVWSTLPRCDAKCPTSCKTSVEHFAAL